jgi:hypothetical protein
VKKNMKISHTLILILLPFLILFHKCGSPTISSDDGIQIDFVSVQDGDSLARGAGILVRFSRAIDLNSLRAQAIEKTADILFADSSGLQLYPINLKIYKIKSSESIILNDSPLTFWYDPRNFEMAFFEETTIQMPFGTGEGFVLNQGSTELIIKSNISAENGEALGKDYKLKINRATSNYQLRAVPNPLYPNITSQGAQSPLLDFIHLPNECQINIKNHNNDLIRSLEHNGDGVERWDLTNTDGTIIEPGIYHFEINENSFLVKGGIIVYPANE